MCPPESELLAHQKWYQRIPCNTKTAAIKKFTAAAAASFTKMRKGDQTARLPGFKSRKDPQQVFEMRASAVHSPQASFPDEEGQAAKG